MLRVHKVRLSPTPSEIQYLTRACGVARFAYNWALAEWQRQYEAHLHNPSLPKPTEAALRRQLNAIKQEQFPWMLEVTKCAPQEAIINLGIAFKNWFSSLNGKRKGPKLGAPKFKKKFQHDSFKVSAGTFAVENSRIRIPNLGWVRMRESLRFEGRLVSATISRTAHAWYVAILVETEDLPPKSKSHAAVGVDLGIKTLATFSDARPDFEGPRAMAVLLTRLQQLQRSLFRKQKGSQNRRKAAAKVANLHWRIANKRQDAAHKLTHLLTSAYGWVAIEDLNVSGMLRNHCLARHIADASFGEIRRQLEYKAKQRGVVLEVVDRWYPSSKTCSVCGAVHEGLQLKDRKWTCTRCGNTHDRDKNAAKNILAVSYTVTACGAGSAGTGRKTRTKLPAKKQESDCRPICL